MQLSSDGHYEDAATQAIHLAEEEALAANCLGDAANQARIRAATRWIDAGDIAFASNPQRAVDAYERCTQIDPSNAIALGRLGNASWWAGHLDKALNAFTQLWQRMPRSDTLMLAASGPTEAEKVGAVLDRPGIPREEHIWIVRGIVVAGLNIVELLQRDPSLIVNWIFRLVPIDPQGTLGSSRRPMEEEASMLIGFFNDRIHNLGNAMAPGAVSVEHRRLLSTLADVSRYRGELNRSEEYLQRARSISVEQRDFVVEAGYLSNLGVIASMRGQINTARDYSSQAITLCKGDPSKGRLYMTTQRFNAAEVDRRRLEHEEQLAAGTADPALRDDEIEVCNLLSEEFDDNPELAEMRAMRLKEIEGNAHGNLARIALEDGDLGLATSEFEISLAIHDSIGHVSGAEISRKALSDLTSGEAR